MGKKPKVVIDTNVFISGFGWKGKPKEILILLQSNKIKNFISEEILNEIIEVLKYPKLKFSNPFQSEIIEFILLYSYFIKPKQNFRVITSDPDDNKFIDCAFAAKADYIITGDSHLLNLGSFEKCKIITPDDFLILNNNSENI